MRSTCNWPGVDTIRQDSDFWKVNYAGAVIIAACIVGGGTAQGLWTDHLLEILMIPAIVFGYSSLWNNRLGHGANLLAAGTVVFLFLQFFPWSPQQNLPAPPLGLKALAFWTLSPSRSLESAVFAASVLGFALFVATMRGHLQTRLVRFVFLGLMINIAVGIIQLSYSGRTNIEGVLPYEITSALFANENHFSALVFATIPLLAWRFLAEERQTVYYLLTVIAVVGVLFAVGSRAGMGISAGLAVLSLVWFALASRFATARILLLALGVAGLLMVYLGGGFGLALESELRPVFFRNTWMAIRDYWITGTGLGTFVIVYPQYEPLRDVIAVYANHAHNDYLELLLEGGVPALLLVILYVALIARNALNSKLSEAATLSILAILLHSLVDYPLRTMAIAIIFALLSTIVLSQPDETAQQAFKGRAGPSKMPRNTSSESRDVM